MLSWARAVSAATCAVDTAITSLCLLSATVTRRSYQLFTSAPMPSDPTAARTGARSARVTGDLQPRRDGRAGNARVDQRARGVRAGKREAQGDIRPPQRRRPQNR